MNRILTSLFFILLFHAVGMFYSCNVASCGNEEPWIIAAQEVYINPYYQRESDTLVVISFRKDTINYDQTFMRIDWDFATAFNVKSTGLFSSAYASAGPRYQNIVDIEIVSDQNYNSEYPAGTPLNDIMRILANDTALTLNRYLEKINSGELRSRRLFASFTEAPSEIIEHQFTLIAIAEDGREINNVSDAVIIK